MSVLSQPTPQISVGPPPTLTYQVSVTNGQAYTLTVFQTLNGTNTVVVSPTSYTGTGSLQTYTFTSPVTSYSYYTSVLIGVTTTNSPSVLYYSPYQGPQGVQGNPGTVGGQGPIGPVGPQGPQGLQGVVSVTNYVTCNSLITSGTSSGTVNAHSTAVLTPAGALSGITTISLPSVAAAAAVSTIYKAASSPDNTITSWGDGSGWRFNFLGNAARTSNVLTLVDNGNVGINCNAPAYTLDVAGNSRILCNANTSTSSFGTTNETLSLMSPCNGYTGGVASIYFGNATANYPLARIYAQDASTGGNYRSRLVFQTNADSSYMAERMRIEAGGNVGINCTPSYQLDVKGSINAFASGSAFSTSILLTATGATANPATSRTLLGSIQMGGQGYGPWLNAYQKNTSYADGVDFSICTNAAGNTQTITERLTVLGGANAGGATRVGIGCNAPSYTLDVTGTINTASQFVANVDATNTNPLSLANNAASGSLLQILQTGTAGGWLNNCVAGDTSIRSFGKLLLAAGSTSGTGILNASIILGNSNYCVGIGSNVNPSSTLDVVGTTRLTTASSLASTAPDGGANHGLMLVSTKAPDSGKTAYSMALGVDSGTGYGYINAAGNTALQPILLQSRGGGVGIGLTTAPNYSLDVYGGSANFSFNGTYGTVFVGSSDGLLIQGYSYGSSYIRADCNAANGISTNALFLGTGGCNVVDITRTDVQCHPTNAFYVRNDKGNGNFVVEGYSYLAQTLISAPGAWSGREANPQPGQLQIYSTSGSARMILGAWYTGGSGAVCTIQSSDYYSSADHGILLTLNPLGGNVGINTTSASYALTVNGSIYASGDVIAYSDARAKTNVATISNALSKVNAMRGVTYAMKTEPDVQKIGVIAQEVEQIIPELVSTDSTPEQKKSVAYGNITAVLIEAIKELTKRLETLERR